MKIYKTTLKMETATSKCHILSVPFQSVYPTCLKLLCFFCSSESIMLTLRHRRQCSESFHCQVTRHFILSKEVKPWTLLCHQFAKMKTVQGNWSPLASSQAFPLEFTIQLAVSPGATCKVLITSCHVLGGDGSLWQDMAHVLWSSEVPRGLRVVQILAVIKTISCSLRRRWEFSVSIPPSFTLTLFLPNVWEVHHFYPGA